MARRYAPALTKQQFLQRRPKGNYQNYLSYLDKNRPGWDINRPGVAQRVAPPQRGPSYTYDSLARRIQILSPQQMEAQANRMAATQLKYQKSMIADEYKAAQEEAMRRMRAFQVAGNQAAAMNASLIGQVGGQYQAGADQLNAMAAGLGGQMAGATEGAVGAANAALGNVGAPAVTVGGPVGAPGIAGSTQAGVEQFYGGTLPAQGMGNAGGYAQAGLAGQISSQNLRATQEAQAAYMQAMGDAGNARSQAMKAMIAGRPEIAMQYLTQLQDNQRQAIALASSLIGSGFEQGMTKKEYGQKVKQQQFENKLTVTKLQQDAAQFQQQLAAKAQENAIDMNRIDASASRAWGYLVKKDGSPVLKNGQLVPVASSSSKSGKRSMTPGQLSSLMQKANTQAEALFYGYGTDSRGKRVPVTQLGTFDPSDPDTWGTGGMDYNQAMTRLRTMNVPAGTARQILDQYYERGDRGRSVFTPTEMKQLRKFMGARKFNWAYAQIQDLLKRNQFAAADQLIDQVLAGGQGISWVGPK